MTTYEELQPIREKLNGLLKGKHLPKTELTIKDFVIMPDENNDKKAHLNFISAIDIGVRLDDVEEAVKSNPWLAIRIRAKNKGVLQYYAPEVLGYTIKELETMVP